MDKKAYRVSGVVAAAGLGLALSSGIAIAEPSDADASDTGTSVSAPSDSEPQSETSPSVSTSDEDAADTQDSADEDPAGDHAESDDEPTADDPVTDEPTAEDGRTVRHRQPRAATTRLTAVRAPSDAPADDDESAGDISPRVVADPGPAAAVDPPEPAAATIPATVRFVRPTVVRPVEAVTRWLTAASVTDTSPPAVSPSLWTLVAWVRRQLGDAATNDGAAEPSAAATPASTSTGTTVNVKDYGAIGDGVTDDSAAIKAAEAALTSGGTLYFPDGDYRFAQQHPAGDAAILVNGLSNVTVQFAPGARLLMDNLDANGNGTSHGIRIVGSASYVTILNPTIEWVTAPSARSFGDGLSVLGWPSDSPPPSGWTGSTGTVEFVSIVNARVVNAPQTGAVIMGASDVTVTDFTAVNTKADGLHVNASRRVTVDGLTAQNTGDDGLAFVTYYHPSQLWTYGPTDGPFNQSGLGAWNNSGSTATHITVTGGGASGVRVQGGYDIAISDVTVSDKDFGVQVNSAKATGPGDWTSLASRDIDISGVTIDGVGTGIVLATNNIDGTDDPMWWNFAGLSISDVTIHDAANWSVAVETPATTTSAFAGVTLRNIYAETGTLPTGGGNGGILLASLRDSVIDGVHLVSNHAADINILGAAQIRNQLAVGDLPSSNLAVDDVVLEGPGRILIQDIAGMDVGDVASYGADGAAVVLYRVKDASFDTITAYLPGRGDGMGRGVQLLQVCGVDIADVEVTMDDHVGSDWWAVELGGGSSGQDIAGNDVHVENVTYVSTRDNSTSDIVVQGGPYGPVNWYVNAHWLHQGEAVPQWRSALYGDTSPV